MFDVGGPELLLILAVALVVLGPRRLPEVGRQIGRGLASLRRASREMRTNLEREVALAELREGARAAGETVERAIHGATSPPDLEGPVAPARAAGEAAGADRPAGKPAPP